MENTNNNTENLKNILQQSTILDSEKIDTIVSILPNASLSNSSVSISSLSNNPDNKKENKENYITTDNELINLFDHLYNHIKSIHNEKITQSNIIALTTELIQLVEKYNNITGNQKKMVIINVIKKLINNQIDTDENIKALFIIIDNTLPYVIDNIVSAINGEIGFNKIKSFFNKIINKILCC